MWVAMSRTTAAVVVGATFLGGGVAGWLLRGGPTAPAPVPLVAVTPAPPAPVQVKSSSVPPSAPRGAPSTSAPAAVRSSPTAGHWYRLGASDTLSEIARRAYGTTKRTADVVAANPGLDAQRLRPGQLVYLPRANESAPPAPPPSPAPARSSK